MHKRIVTFAASIGLCLLLAAGSALAQDGNGNGNGTNDDNLQDRTLDVGGTSGGNR